MKLVLATNQTDRFIAFHTDIQKDEKVYDYSDYKSLLFYFEKNVAKFTDLISGNSSDHYDGVYINGYLHSPEIAYSVATVLDHQGIAYVNSELRNAPSLTKLTSYAKLASHGVDIPKTFAGTAYALRAALASGQFDSFALPVVIKRADADRGVDNFVFKTYDSVRSTLDAAEDMSIWLVQEFLPNNGFYLATFYHEKLSFGIFRSLEKRPDNREELAHMFKPKGGSNAHFMEPDEVPLPVADVSLKAIKAMGREIASVDTIYDEVSGRVSVLEVNYNPQLVTVSVFNEAREAAFIKAMKTIE